MRHVTLILIVSWLSASTAAAEPFVKVSVDPAEVTLEGRDATWLILVQGETKDGRFVDLTDQAQFHSLTPNVAEISSRGVVRAVSDGQGVVEVTAGGKRLELPVKVTRSTNSRLLNFNNDIIPILSRYGCNSSGCHGKAEGQNGFKLSVFGFDPSADYQALTMEGRGRRVFPAAAERSLLLRKVSGHSPHGGGVRIDTHRPEYRMLLDWIASGVPRGSGDDPKVVKIELSPRQRRMSMSQSQRLRAVATLTNGSKMDVTSLAQFQSNNKGLADVDESGLVTTGTAMGAVAVMATYMGQVDVFQALIPREQTIAEYPSLAENSFIDELVHRKLKNLNVVPSGPANDADYLRRVYLDIIGTLPTAAEARAFLTDQRPDRRAKLVDQLLERPEYADYWALKWADLLRVNRRELGHKSAYQYYKWIRDSFAANKTLDRFARELVTAEGPLSEAPAGQFYKVVKQPNEMASIVSQVFLGVRIECAQCHHHPFDRWSQTDYYGMQAFFTQVGFKKSASDEMILASANRQTKHPRTGATVFAHALATKMPEESPQGDRRRILADWMTAADNPWFARNIVNRAWAHFMGRGLVEPVDDVRLTNPPSNPELLDALAKHFVEVKFDYRELIRTITASRAYQRSHSVNETNERDEQNYSRFLFKQLDAEVLLDAICQTTGIDEKFRGVPSGSRGIQLWDSEVPHDFLKLFGRPVRASACECERVTDPTVAQVLHVLNSPRIQGKLSHDGGRIAGLTRQFSDDDQLVEELYLTFFSRFPNDDERNLALGHLKKQANRRQAAEDIAWSMMNSLEFLFNH